MITAIIIIIIIIKASLGFCIGGGLFLFLGFWFGLQIHSNYQKEAYTKATKLIVLGTGLPIMVILGKWGIDIYILH